MQSWIPENTWISEACDILLQAAQQPKASNDWILFALAWLIGGLAMMKVMSSLLGNMNDSLGSNLMILILGWVVALAAAGAAAFWWAPKAGTGEWVAWIPVIAAVPAVLLIVVPIHMKLQKIGYGTALLTLLGAILVATLLHIVFRTAADGVQRGRIQFKVLGDRTEHVNKGLK